MPKPAVLRLSDEGVAPPMAVPTGGPAAEPMAKVFPIIGTERAAAEGDGVLDDSQVDLAMKSGLPTWLWARI